MRVQQNGGWPEVSGVDIEGGPLTVALAAPGLIDRGSRASSPCCVGKLTELRNAER
jgi:hypothetical protein